MWHHQLPLQQHAQHPTQQIKPSTCFAAAAAAARSFISDITTQQCRQLLKREAGGSLFDVVVHDGAPNVGGAWASEAYTQVRQT